MKRPALLWLLLLSAFTALASIPPHNVAGQQAAPSGEQAFLPASAAFMGRAVEIPMRDGKKLAADLYLPKTAGRFPVVLIQTPYNKAPMRAAFSGPSRYGPDSLFTDTSYAFVIVNWRGKFASQGALSAGETADSGRDGFDVCAWIAAQEWSDGRIATWGPSALGRVQYETARQNPPNLVCAVPLVAPLNLDYDAYFPGGVMWEEFAIRLGQIGFGTTIRDNLAARPVKNEDWQALTANYIKGADLRVPLLFIGGWFDIYTDTVIAAYETARDGGGEKARAHSRLIIGPWPHRTDELKSGELEFPAAEFFGMKQARAFIDHWMKGAPKASANAAPRITYFQMGANEWRSTESWPPRGSRPQAFYLMNDKTLAAKMPNGQAAPLTFRYDPANPAPTVGGHVLTPELKPGPADQRAQVESRGDVLVFSTPALNKELAIAGKVSLKLFVSSDRADTDFTAILTDVYPDGRSMLIAEGVKRMRFRNTTAKEELMKPGAVYPVTIELNNTALTFLKGHRARLIVSSSNYPKYAINLNDGGAMYEKGQGLVATNRVYVSKQHSSALLLPVVAGGEDASSRRAGKIEALRTPDDRFANLPGYNYKPHYVEVQGLRMHYLDEGPPSAPPVLLLHGEPSWSYLYRKMIPILTAAGHRVIAPDFLGFGRSDKPVRREDYTYQLHVDTLGWLLQKLKLREITLVCQDWGGLVGLRVAAEHPERFARIVAANTGLPTGDRPPGEAFMRWQQLSQTVEDFNIGNLLKQASRTEMPPEVVAAYNAPFPDDRYKAGARIFPMLVPTKPDDPASAANRKAWEVFRRWKKPFLTAFSDGDAITRGGEIVFQQQIPGSKGQAHVTIKGAGHFLQEDKGEELARVVVDFIMRTEGKKQ